MSRAADGGGAGGPHVIVVGAGIAGLYCARELAARDCTVEVLELTDRWGGRIETGRLKPGKDGENSKPFPAEFGPMRFELEIQPLMRRLLGDYGLNAGQFPLPGGAVPPMTFDLAADEKHGDVELPAYELFKVGVCRMFGMEATAGAGDEPGDPPKAVLSRDTMVWLRDLDDARLDELRRTAKLPGTDRALRDEGLWNALTTTLSPNAVRKIMQHGSFFHFLPENLSALEWGIFWLHAFKVKEMTTLDDGVDKLTDMIVKDLRRPGGQIKLRGRRKVVALRQTAGGRVEVDAVDPGRAATRRVSTYTADHVVLAIPKVPLDALADAFPPEVRDVLNSVNAFPMVKVFCVTKTPKVWRDAKTQQMPQQGAWLIPTREVHYLPLDEAHDYTLVMFYTDRPSTTFWQRYVTDPDGHDRAETNRNPALAEALALQLSVLHVDVAERELPRRCADAGIATGDATQGEALRPAQEVIRLIVDLFDDDADALLEAMGRPELVALKNACEPLVDFDATRAAQLQDLGDYAIRDWSRPPYGAASHAWIPGADALAVMATLRAFSLDGGTRQNVHVAGEAFSDFQGFIEGALRSAMSVIEIIAPAGDRRVS
jgi:monoamine oxidase